MTKTTRDFAICQLKDATHWANFIVKHLIPWFLVLCSCWHISSSVPWLCWHSRILFCRIPVEVKKFSNNSQEYKEKLKALTCTNIYGSPLSGIDKQIKYWYVTLRDERVFAILNVSWSSSEDWSSGWGFSASCVVSISQDIAWQLLTKICSHEPGIL